MCIRSPSQCADDVSSVLGVSVVEEVLRCCILSLYPPIYTTLLTPGPRQNVELFLFIALSSVGFCMQRYTVIVSDLHLGKFLGKGCWVLMLSTVVCPLPPTVTRLLMFACFINFFLGCTRVWREPSVLSAYDLLCVEFNGLK